MGQVFSEKLAQPSRAYTSLAFVRDERTRSGASPASASDSTMTQNASARTATAQPVSSQGASQTLYNLRDQAFKLLDYNRSLRTQAYCNYQDLWHRRTQLQKRARMPAIQQEARENRAIKSPEMMALHSDHIRLAKQMDKVNRNIMFIEHRLSIYSELIEKVEMCISGDNDHKLLSDFVQTAGHMFEQIGNRENPLSELSRITGEIQNQISQRDEAGEVLGDEIDMMNESTESTTSDVLSRHNESLQQFVKNISKSPDRAMSATKTASPRAVLTESNRAAASSSSNDDAGVIYETTTVDSEAAEQLDASFEDDSDCEPGIYEMYDDLCIPEQRQHIKSSLPTVPQQQNVSGQGDYNHRGADTQSTNVSIGTVEECDPA